MPQWLKALATKPDDLNLIPDTNMVRGENQVLQVVLGLPCARKSPLKQRKKKPTKSIKCKVDNNKKSIIGY